MKAGVLYLVPDLFGLPGGIALYCRHVCQALLDAGIRPNVLALHDRQTAINAPAAALPYTACQGSRANFIKRSVMLAVQGRPGLILVGHPHLAPLGWLLARLSGARWIVFMYGVEVWQPLSRIRRWALRRADQLIAISHFTAQRAAKANGVSREKVRILHNCLPPHFEPPAQPKNPNQPPSLLTVARMSLNEDYKGHDYVIRALPVLLERFPDLVYTIVGDGDARPALEALARAENVAQAVRFCGIVSDQELARLYDEASVFVMPSRGEGFGFVFIEAMAHGIPVIGGTLDAAPEVIVDGETGYLVDPTSVNAIIEAVSYLLSDASLRQRIGRAAVCHVAQNFGFEDFQQRLLSYLEELVPQKNPVKK